MTQIREAAEAAQSEDRSNSPVVWEALLLDESGFCISDHENVAEVIRLFPDMDAIDRTYGDLFPASIEIVTGSASPKPMGSLRRCPGSHYTADKIYEFDLEQVEDADELDLLWERAQAMAKGLNDYEVERSLA